MPTARLPQAEYEALRATIRERGSLRLCTVLGGLVAWGALVVAVRIADLQGALQLVPLLILAATFEVNLFVHTGVERIGRYLQVFHEEADGALGWETTAMQYGSKYPGGLDPLFGAIFVLGAALNLFSSLATGGAHLGWSALSLFAHLLFAYRIVAARSAAGTQRAKDLERFASLKSK